MKSESLSFVPFFARIASCASTLSLLTLTGCGMFGYSPGKIAAGHFESLVASVNSQEDPELVRQGFPTMILLLDSMLQEEPDNPDLLLAASTAYAGYAQAFLVPKEENARAVLLYGRAKEYGLKLLCRRSFFAAAQDEPFGEYEKALSCFGRDDVPGIYAAANAWLGWILSQTDSMAALSEMPKALTLMRRVLELDETYACGGAHLVFGIYYAVQPPGGGRDMEKSKMHFTRAMELSGNGKKLPQVIYAEYYAVTAGDRELFSSILTKTLEKPEHEQKADVLGNAIARERARRLLDRKEDLF
ncbi:MAG: TRAP transporter TatT component family protein [Victivallales bacterium]